MRSFSEFADHRDCQAQQNPQQNPAAPQQQTANPANPGGMKFVPAATG